MKAKKAMKRAPRVNVNNSAETHAAIAAGKEPGVLARIMAGDPPVSKSKVGALVRYCGHDAMFVADVIEINGACVVVAADRIDNCLIRPATAKATHHLRDFPVAGYWNPRAGFFVVPSDQVDLL